MFKDVHPTSTGGKKVFRGKDKQDRAGVKGNESRWVRCRHCGFAVDTERHPRGEQGVENSISSTTSSYTHPITGETLYYGDPTVSAGCPLCGSRDY